MKHKKLSLVLPDHTIVDTDELRNIKRRAIEEWEKANKKEHTAINRKIFCESVIKEAMSRMRLLRILISGNE